ncbi:uncharacterized protein LOC8275168 [Ricinus communis]|uniref:Plant bHLH transcription factor ACT-like domain-containing protein n=1 Tax=Ricinus communis TaxID=3988 RepID=B9S8C7_RICCO|nr:uncharacterized protein LOC8275168 [Ricinus communis]EEF40104.1 conserved hypothetical protein [Ricinus communis]|eukprot:XP_002522246.1 uncharacterized protein LOC8275168 [Ricinus communis]
MVSGVQRRMVLRNKLHILRTLTCSKSVKRNCIIADAVLYIYKLSLKVEAIKRELSNLNAIKSEYLRLMKQVQCLPKREVKVEKAGKGFLVRVICEKGGGKLVPILEAFEKMGLIVLNAKVSCNFYFGLEAIVVAEEQHALDVNNVTQEILEAIDR